jgi:Ca2+-binding RTX toxin-like protein
MPGATPETGSTIWAAGPSRARTGRRVIADPFQSIGTQNIIFSGLGSGSPPITDTVEEGTFRITTGAGPEAVTVTNGGSVDSAPTTQVNGDTFVGIRVHTKDELALAAAPDDTLDFNNPLPAAGLVLVSATGFGTVTQSGAVNYSDLRLANIRGTVTLTGNNDVDHIAAELTAGGAFSFNDVDDIEVATVGSTSGISTANTAITITTANGSAVVRDNINAGTATVTLTAGSTGAADNAVSVVSSVTGTGGVTLTGDNIGVGLGTTVNAGTAVATLQPFQAGTLIDVGGGDGVNKLGLADPELDGITAGAIVIGNSTAGNLSVTATIAPAGSSTLILRSGGTITQTAGSALLMPNLGTQAGTGVVLDSFGNSFTNVEAETDTGGITVLHAGALTIGGVSGELTGLLVNTSGNIGVTNFGTITLADSNGTAMVQGGSISGNVTLIANGATADVTSTVNLHAITASRGDIAISAGQDILFGTAGTNFNNNVVASGSVILSAGRDVTIDGLADVTADDFGNSSGGGVTITAGRDINVTNLTGAGATIGVSGNAGGDVTLTTGTDGFLRLTSPLPNAVFSNAGDVTANADRVAISASSGVTASNGIVTIQPVSGGRLIDLGSIGDAAVNSLQLSDAELDRIFTPILRAGNATAGNITVSASIAAVTGSYGTLSLSTGGGILDGTGTEQADLTVNSLALRSANGIGAADDLDTAVSLLAFNNTIGAVNIVNTGPLTIGSVDGLASSSNTGTTTSITTTSPLTFAANVATTADSTYTAGETSDPPTAADDLTIGNGVVVSVTAGSLALRAGDDIILQSGSAASASGNVVVTAGAADLDGRGAISLAGNISAGTTVTLQSLQGISQTAGAVTGNDLAVAAGGPVLLTGSNDATNMAAAVSGPGNGFSYVDVDDITIASLAGRDGISTNNGDIAISTVNGAIDVAQTAAQFEVDAGSAAVTLTAGSTGAADNAISFVTGADVRGRAGITLTADNILIATSSVDAATGTAALQPFQAGTLIDLGGADAANTLGLAGGELDNIAARNLHIGNAGAGSVTVTANITPPGVTEDITIQSGANIVVNAGFAIQSLRDLTLRAGGNMILQTGASLSGRNISIFVDGPDNDPAAGGTADLRSGTTTATGVISVTGGGDGDTLLGSAAGETFLAQAGQDFVAAAGGNDRLFGDAGNDTLLGGTGDDELTGGAGADLLRGDDGRDVLRGGAGADRLEGRDGDDNLLGEADNDLLVGGAGNDGLDGGTGNDVLLGQDGDDRLNGREGNDRLIGGDGRDILHGEAGNDRLEGRGGNDSLFGGDGSDLLFGANGADRLDGGVGNDRLLGLDDADILRGAAGNDRLIGGRGADTLLGGGGADTFELRATDETGTSAAAADLISDFNRAQGDRIQLWAIDSDITAAGNQVFAFVGSAAFSDAGQIRFTTGGGETRILLNTDADAAAEAMIRVRGIHTPTADWFAL